jgi:glycogen debranching enzyme
MSVIRDRADIELIEIDPSELLNRSPEPCDPSMGTLGGLVLKEGNIFFLTDSRGNVPDCGKSQLGMFYEDTRFLSRWELQVRDHEPQVLSSQANRVFCSQIDLTTTWSEGVKDIYEHNFIHVRRRQVIGGKMVERLRVSNYLNTRQRISFTVHYAADFADMFEVRGMERENRGTYYRPIITENAVTLFYRGLDNILRGTRIEFGEPPSVLDANSATYNLTIPANGTFLVEMHVTPVVEELNLDLPVLSYSQLYQQNAEKYGRWRQHCTLLHSEDEFLQSSLGQSVTDLRALLIHYHDQQIVSAGIPWYSTPFGRDAVITGLQTLMINPDISRDTLRFLARYQGKEVNDFTAEEPGKIMHEIRRGEMANCGEIPHIPYYGTVDATPLFVVLLHEYFLWTGDEEFVRELLPNAERAIEWLDQYGDVDADGLVEYWKFTERGILHQGWKDSVDGVTFPDSTQPHLPIALIEVQGYAYDAKVRMSRIYRSLGMQEKARQMRAAALQIQSAIEEHFWMRDDRYYALGLDGRKRKIPTITSNPGHLLYSRAVTQTNAARMDRRMMAEDMYSGWGIRTLSSTHAAFNPLSYHNGSVWPHDNSIIAMGLCHYNLKRSAERIFLNLFESCMHFKYYRLPELFCGMTRQPNDSPVHYPVACTPQAWAAASFFLILQGLIGVRPDAPQRRLYIENPHLPQSIDELTINNMRIGNSRISLRVTRNGERTFVNVVEQSGDPIRVTIEWE